MKNENLPTLYTYGNYSSGNYGAHCMALKMPASRTNKHGITLYYSYDTLVAFRGFVDGRTCLIVRRNIWGNTTGKHLNMIDNGDKQNRVNGEEFERLYKKAIKNA